MKGPDPVSKQIPTEDGGYQTYKAADKLKGKRSVITGGDSGIGRAIAILFAMEGAEVFINYLPEEESDAQTTKKEVGNREGSAISMPQISGQRKPARRSSTKPSPPWADSTS